MITARRNGKYITRNTSYFKSVNPAIQEGTDDEEQEDDDESMIGEQSRSAEGQVSVRDLRRSQHGKKTFKHFGQNIYEQ